MNPLMQAEQEFWAAYERHRSMGDASARKDEGVGTPATAIKIPITSPTIIRYSKPFNEPVPDWRWSA